MSERELFISHPIGAAGRFRLSCPSGFLRIDGVDGDTAEVRARYHAPAGVTLGADAEADGVVDVVREAGALSVATRDPGGGGFLAGLVRRIGAWRPDVTYDVRVPRGAIVSLQAASADGELRGLRGDQDVRVVSGDLRLTDTGGRLRLTTVSGDISVAGDVLWVAATTTSGDIVVDAELIQAFSARSVSGDVVVRGPLGRDGGHTFESVSGDLQLSTPSGVSVEMQSLSGSVRSDLASRRETRGGRSVFIVGDGAVGIRARTVSGDVLVGGPSGGSGRSQAMESTGLAGDLASFGRDMAALGASLTRDITRVTLTDISMGQTDPPRPPDRPEPPTPRVAPAPAPAAPSTGTGAPDPAVTRAAAQQLAILRQLEAGAIDIEEATRRLEAIG